MSGKRGSFTGSNHILDDNLCGIVWLSPETLTTALQFRAIRTGRFLGREAIEKHYADDFKGFHSSNNIATPDEDSPQDRMERIGRAPLKEASSDPGQSFLLIG
jgi:hypothetical protein